MDNTVNLMPDDEESEPIHHRTSRRDQTSSREGGGVERQLAQYGFTREERDREVRLLLRDVAADEVAMSFRAAGATLITVTGERAVQSRVRAARHTEPVSVSPEEEADVQPPQRPKRESAAPPTGELTMRYFYALGETVYTISITTTSEVVASVAGVYPVATLPEQELQGRLAVVFRSARL